MNRDRPSVPLCNANSGPLVPSSGSNASRRRPPNPRLARQAKRSLHPVRPFHACAASSAATYANKPMGVCDPGTPDLPKSRAAV